ncbi:hypothetical protein [Gynurincola endophyticus]|uniref:hypothetical protein n=1 Tax=Gynurincola endophyticus TaxID=2479004 RepID=UPI000F8F64CD|nr:hypothetical protein [Gynurincola endophyticus]
MYKILITVFLFLYTDIANAQKGKFIKYYFPDSIEILINTHLSSKNQRSDIKNICLKLDSEDDLYRLIIIENIDVKSSTFYWKKRTNRFAVINSNLIPLIFDLDEKFSAPFPQTFGNYGKREGEIRKVSIIYHGPIIYFNSYGEIIKVAGFLN